MSLSTLAGTTWLITSNPAVAGLGHFLITGHFRGQYSPEDVYPEGFDGIALGYSSQNWESSDGEWYPAAENFLIYTLRDFTTNFDIGDTLEITGGTDATNSTLIAWFEANGTQIIDPLYGTIKVKGTSGDDLILLPKTTISQVEGIPVPTSADNGKAISVNSSGNYVLANKMANPMTTQGDIIYGGSSGTPTRLGKGTAGQVLTMNSGATAPVWTTPASGGVTSFGGATGAITLGSGLSMTGNQLTLSITSYDGTVIELGYSGNITSQNITTLDTIQTKIKFGSAPTSDNDFDSIVNVATGVISGDTTYSSETKVYVWGTTIGNIMPGVIINGVTTNGSESYTNAVEVTLTGNYDIALIYHNGGGGN